MPSPAIHAKNIPAMADDITTRPVLEALLEGQRHLSEQLTGFGSALARITQRQDEIAAKQDALAARQDALAARQDALEAGLIALTREVRDGFDEYNRRVDALNKRLLSFETWLSRIDDRLHDEIVARTR